VSTKPLKVKILGSGKAAEKHEYAFEFLGLYTPNSSNPDVVDICTPPGLHCQQIMDVLENSHVIVEKPICGSLADMDKIILMSGLTEHQVMPIAQYRFADPDDITDNITTSWRRHDRWYDGWRNNWELSLGGCLVSHGIHLIDLIIQDRGMPKWVFCHMDFTRDVETAAIIRMDDVKLSIKVHDNIPGGFDLGDSNEGFIRQFSEFYNSIRYGTALPVTLEETRKVIEVITACYYSHFTRSPVFLPLKQNHPFYGGWTEHLETLSQQSRFSRKEYVPPWGQPQ